jgi:hypothetical protein
VRRKGKPTSNRLTIATSPRFQPAKDRESSAELSVTMRAVGSFESAMAAAQNEALLATEWLTRL